MGSSVFTPRSQEGSDDRGVFGRSLPQAQESFFSSSRNSQGHDHHFARIRLGVDEDHGEAFVVEPAFGQLGHLGRRGPHEAATHARPLHAEARPRQLHNPLVTPRGNAVHHMVERGLRHGVGRLEQLVAFEFRFPPAIGVTHAGLVNRNLLAGQRDEAPLLAEPGLRAVLHPFMPLTSSLGNLVGQQAVGHFQAHLHREAGERLPRQLQQRFHIQWQLHFPSLRDRLLRDPPRPTSATTRATR